MKAKKDKRNKKSLMSQGFHPKRPLFVSIVAIFMFILTGSAAWAQTLTVTDITDATVTVYVDCPGDCIDIELNWADGTPFDNITSPGNYVHTYTSSGTYCIELYCFLEPCVACEEVTVTVGDTSPPTITITSPTNTDTYSTSTSTITLGGTASDNTGVTQVTWANDRGGSGTAAGTTSWTAAGIVFQSGTNVLTVTAYDAANNTGTDTITVTYAPAVAFSVTVSPSTASVVPNLNNVISVLYTALATGGASMTASSTQGIFVTEGGSLLGTVDTSVAIDIQAGFGAVTETLTVPASIITAALAAKENRVLFRRTFSAAGQTATSEVTLQIVPVAAGDFSISFLELNFLEPRKGKTGQITVPRNTANLKVLADLKYNGSGIFQARWKVDGQILGYVTRQFYPGIDTVTIESPEIPHLPTYDTGRHQVELEILQPQPGFDEPVIYYYVTDARAVSTLQLLAPADNVSVPLSTGAGVYPEFSWQVTGSGHIYQFELYAGESGARGTPLVRSRTQAGSYMLSQYDLEKLSPNVPYTWLVLASEGGQPVAASQQRTIYFSAPEQGPGEIQFQYLNIRETPEPEPEKEKESLLFRLFGIGTAYAADLDSGVASTEFTVKAGQSITIAAGITNQTDTTKNNIRVEFLVDGKVVDVSFITSLPPGALTEVEGVYEVPDSQSHTLEVRALEGEGEGAVVLASIGGSLTNEADADAAGKDLAAEDFITIGEFVVALISTTGDDNNLSGRGNIAVPFLDDLLDSIALLIGVSFENLEINDGVVTGGSIVVDLQIGDNQPWNFELGPATVYINKFIFGTDQALIEGRLEIAFPFANANDPDQKLIFNFTDLSVHPDNGLSGDLTLAQAVTIPLLLDGFNVSFAANSTLTLYENAISLSSVTGSVQLPDSILMLANGAGLEFGNIVFEQDGGFMVDVTLDTTTITGTDFELSGTLTLDFTTMSSPVGSNLSGAWMGVYLKTGTLTMPRSIKDLVNDQSFEVTISGLNITTIQGLSGTVNVSLGEKKFELGEGSYKFSGELNEIELTFDNFSALNPNISGKFTGFLTLALLDNAKIGTQLIISPDGISSSMTLENDIGAVELAGKNLKLTIKSGTSIEFQTQPLFMAATLKTEITALGQLGGDLETEITVDIYVDTSGEIGILSAGVDDLQYWRGIGPLDVKFLDVFTIGITEFGFGFKDDQLFVGVGGSLTVASISDESNITDASARVGLYMNGELFTERIYVSFIEPGAFKFEGDIEVLQDATYGKGFHGSVGLTVVDSFSTESELYVGKHGEGYYYFYINGDIDFPAPGFPLTPYPISFYSFGGGAYFNMAPQRDENNLPTGRYLPAEDSFGLLAKVGIGTSFDDGYTFNGEIELEIGIDVSDQNSGFDLTFYGDAYILSKRMEPKDERLIHAVATIGCHEGSGCAFSGLIQIENFAIVKPDKAVVSISGEMDMKFAGLDDWHLYMGRKETPAEVKILPMFNPPDGIGIAKAYFELDKLGIRTGYLVEVDTGRKTILIFYGRAYGGNSADVEVSFDPVFIYAEFSVWMGLEAGLDLGSLGEFPIIDAQAILNGGVRTPDPTRLWASGELSYEILGGMFSGDWSMTFSWGDELPSEIEMQATWPIYHSMNPEENSNEVDIGSNIMVRLTTPVSNGPCGRKTIVYGDEEGNERSVEVYQDEFLLFPVITEDDGYRPLFEDQFVTGQINWNSTCTAFTFEPEGMLYPNLTYNVIYRGHAQGDLLLVSPYEEETSLAFTTGDFPETIDRMVKHSYPRKASKHVYTEYPVQVEFTKALPILETEHITGILYKVEGESRTTVPGTYTLSQPDYRSAAFVPDSPLEQNMFYEFKLERPIGSGDQREEIREENVDEAITIGNAGSARQPGSGIELESPTVPLAVFAENLGREWLTIKFETGSYPTFKAMLEASDMNLHVERPTLSSHEEVDEYWNAPEYNVYFSMAELVDWGDIIIEPESINSPASSAFSCTLNLPTPYTQLDAGGNPIDIEPEIDPDNNAGGCYTQAESRGLRRYAYGQMARMVLGPGEDSGLSTRNKFTLITAIGPYRVIPAQNDCQGDIRIWDRDLERGDIEVSNECRDTLITLLADGADINLYHKFTPLGNQEKKFTITLDLPDLPDGPDGPDGGDDITPQDEGGINELDDDYVDEQTPDIEVNDGLFQDGAHAERDIFYGDIFGRADDVLGDLGVNDDLIGWYADLVNGYQDMVSEYDNMNQTDDLMGSYNDLNAGYNNLANEMSYLLNNPSKTMNEDINGLLDNFENMNSSFENLNRGTDLF